MDNNKWWGEFSFAQDEQKCWSLADRAIVIKRRDNEWNTWNFETDTENDNEVLVSNGDTFAVEDTVAAGRFLEKNIANTIRVTPRLADRTIVARPASPVTILAGETVQLFISTPIWFHAATSPGDKSLIDLPFWRPSDSWFGSSTIDGEICYAKYTSAKTRFEDLDMHAHRATTKITVINSHKDAFTINRINVPVNYLYLYSDDKNCLWTSGVSIERANNSEHIEVIIEKNLLQQQKAYQFVSNPRLISEQGKLIRSISHLFG